MKNILGPDEFMVELFDETFKGELLNLFYKKMENAEMLLTIFIKLVLF